MLKSCPALSTDVRSNHHRRPTAPACSVNWSARGARKVEQPFPPFTQRDYDCCLVVVTVSAAAEVTAVTNSGAPNNSQDK